MVFMQQRHFQKMWRRDIYDLPRKDAGGGGGVLSREYVLRTPSVS